MIITREQISNMDDEEIDDMIEKAVERGDKEFIMSILPLYVEYYGDFDVMNFEGYFENSNFLEDRNIVLELVKRGFEVPKELYGNDEEVILEAVKNPDTGLLGFDLANESIKTKEFVMRMISNSGSSSDLKYILENEDCIPRQLFEDKDVTDFIKMRIEELKVKEQKKSLEDMSLEELQNVEQNNEKIIEDNDKMIKQELIQKILKQQKIIAQQEIEKKELRAKNKEL